MGKYLRNIWICCSLWTLLSCDNPPPVDADEIAIRWEMGENFYQEKAQFLSSFVLTNRGKNSLTDEGWTIYFNFTRYIKAESTTGNVAIKHINGDFYSMSPKDDFLVKAGESVRIDFVSSDWSINESEAPAGLYLVPDNDGKEGAPMVITNYEVSSFLSEDQSRRNKDDRTPVVSAALRYEKNTTTTPNANDIPLLIPQPVSYVRGNGTFVLNHELTFEAQEGLSAEKKLLEDLFAGLLENPLVAGQKKIQLRTGPVTLQGKSIEKPESYKLDITPSSIVITGTDRAGVFYGIQTLKALIPVQAWNNKNSSIEFGILKVVDHPRFSYRGIHLDVARNFQQKSTVLKMLDLMSFYKLNKLHFHLSDDEGWRVALKTFPELTQVGGKRGHDRSGKGMVPSFGSGPFADNKNSNGSGFYTEADFVEILRYATARNIEVIPKIDMPGHARAAIVSMNARYERLIAEGKQKEAEEFLLRDPNDSSKYRSVQSWNDNVLSVCSESTYKFIKAILVDFKRLYKDADAPFNTFHIGADEVPHGVWERSPACATLIDEEKITTDDLQQYFFRRVSTILQDEGLNMGGWEEIALKKIKKENEISLEPNPEFVKSNFKPYVWNSVWGWEQEDIGYKLANAGYKIVLGNVTNLYFDMAYEKHPEEPGYYWGAFVDTKTVFDFNPFDIYSNARTDKFEQPLDMTKMARKIRLGATGRENILGIQGQLWSENIKGEESLEYMAFPKLLALSERAWAAGTPSPSSWNAFATKLGTSELKRLDAWDVNYRISPPGAVIRDDQLFANVEYPDLVIRFTTDGSEPTISSQRYEGPVKVHSAIVKLRTFNSINRSSRTVVAKAD